MLETFSNRNHRQKIITLILSGYILISVLTVFHFHNFNLLRNPEIKNIDSNPSSGLSINGNSQFVCTIHFNYSQLHSVNLSDLAISRFRVNFENIDFFPENDFNLLSAYIISPTLRAPPTA